MKISKGMFAVAVVLFLSSQNVISAEVPVTEIKSQPINVKSDSPSKPVAIKKFGAQSAAVAFEKLLTEAEALIKSGKSAEAYKLLEPLDFERSGNPRFDYMLGIAALDSGHPDKSTLALERVLAIEPNFAGARLDMARAYFQLGDLARAKTELEAVMKQDPPEAARITINKYLAAIVSAEQANKTRYSGYAEGSFGRDSNVNNSTSQSQVAVPAFGNLIFTLSPTNQKTPDNYYSAAAGGDLSHSLTDRWGVYGGADLRKRGNMKVRAFDSESVDARLGISYSKGDDVFRVGGSESYFEQAHIKNRNAYGWTTDWRHSLNQNNQLNVFGQYTRNRFADSAFQINDFNQAVIGTGFLNIFNDAKSALFGSVNWASERAVNDRADGNKSGFGLRVGGQTSMLASTEVFANVGYQIGKYDKENIAFLAFRNDKQVDASLGGVWHADKYWTVRPQISYTKNNSNIPIYSFDRLDASITVRRDFR
jgi:tetratricopeptide (TPR) repeat protein